MVGGDHDMSDCCLLRLYSSLRSHATDIRIMAVCCVTTKEYRRLKGRESKKEVGPVEAHHEANQPISTYMKIVIAPDSFKESLSAVDVAKRLEAGFREIFAGAEYVCVSSCRRWRGGHC